MSHLPDDMLQDWAKSEEQPRRSLAFELMHARTALREAEAKLRDLQDPHLTDDGVAVVPSDLRKVQREALEAAVAAFGSRINELRETLRQMAEHVSRLRANSPDTIQPAAPDSLPSPETRPPSGRMCGRREHQAPLSSLSNLGPAAIAELTKSESEKGYSKALLDVIAERRKQLSKWGPEHDAQHDQRQLLHIAASLLGNVLGIHTRDRWGIAQKHPRHRDQVVIAAALLVAELDRTDAEGGVQ